MYIAKPIIICHEPPPFPIPATSGVARDQTKDTRQVVPEPLDLAGNLRAEEFGARRAHLPVRRRVPELLQHRDRVRAAGLVHARPEARVARRAEVAVPAHDDLVAVRRVVVVVVLARVAATARLRAKQERAVHVRQALHQPQAPLRDAEHVDVVQQVPARRADAATRRAVALAPDVVPVESRIGVEQAEVGCGQYTRDVEVAG